MKYHEDEVRKVLLKEINLMIEDCRITAADINCAKSDKDKEIKYLNDLSWRATLLKNYINEVIKV